MNKITFSLLFSLSLFVLFTACKGGAETTDQTNAGQEAEAPSQKQSVASQLQFVTVELNNGEKWEADALTKLGVEDIKKSLGDIDVTANDEDYRIFFDNINSVVKQAYKSSELEGDAKAQFANYLRNVVQVVDHLNTSDTFVRQEAHDELVKVLDSFNEYFK